MEKTGWIIRFHLYSPLHCHRKVSYTFGLFRPLIQEILNAESVAEWLGLKIVPQFEVFVEGSGSEFRAWSLKRKPVGPAVRDCRVPSSTQHVCFFYSTYWHPDIQQFNGIRTSIAFTLPQLRLQALHVW